MPFEHLASICFTENTAIRKVLKKFSETAIHTEGRGFGIIVSSPGKCIGVVSDGDIRKKIVEGIDIDAPISSAMNQDFTFVSDKDSFHKILRQFDKRVVNLPVLDAGGKPVDLYLYSKFSTSTRVRPRIIRARVPVRVSFAGGGTDMSEYINQQHTAILSSTINKYCTASVLVRPDNEIHIHSKDLNKSCKAKSFDAIEYGDDLDLLKAAIKVIHPDFGFDLEVLAEFDPGTGLGGSSAAAVAVIGALNYFRNETQMDLYHISDLAYQAERIELGMRGGWQDQYATAFGGFNWIEFSENEVIVNPLRIQQDVVLELEYNLMLFRTGESRNSTDIQNDLISDFRKNGSVRKPQYAEMAKLAEQMKESLLKGKVKKFGDLLHSSWEMKKSIGSRVSNPEVENHYNTAKQLGALGGKLLGAGGSGYLLIYASPLYQKAIKEALEEKGSRLERFKFSHNGLEAWSASS